MQGYVNLYGGSVFTIEAKWAETLKVVFVTLTFGAGIPILYPIAAVSFIVFYSVEKY